MDKINEVKQKTALKSNGVYSVVKNEWIKEPVAADIPEIDKDAFDKEFKIWEDRYNKIIDSGEKELKEELIKEDNEFGKYKSQFIDAINNLNPALLHKGTESRQIYNRHSGEIEDKLLWDSVLHHIDGNHDNNPFDFSNYTLIQCNDYSTAMLIHRLVHLLSFAENGTAADSIKDKIRSYNPEFITIINNKVDTQDFDSWWDADGNKILDSISQKINDMQPGKQIVLEDLSDAKSIIADQIRGEWEAIRNYEKAVDDLNNIDGDFDSVIKILNDIADEEEVHVGELTQAQAELDNNVLNNIEEGHEEAEEKMSETANDLEYNEEPVEESLNEEMKNKKVEEIEKYLEDVYDMRKQAIAEDGEYSIKNLVFKELRNKGYLDNLRDLKAELVSKELSLN